MYIYVYFFAAQLLIYTLHILIFKRQLIAGYFGIYFSAIFSRFVSQWEAFGFSFGK